MWFECQAKCEFDLSPVEKTLITSVVFFGMMVGAFTWGMVADARGRKTGFFATALFTAVMGFASAFSPNYGVRTTTWRSLILDSTSGGALTG